MDRAEAKRSYKEAPPDAGVYTVHDRRSGRRLVASSPNVRAALNRHRFSLGVGAHRNRRLQQDWDESGSEGIAFEVLERVDPTDPRIRDLREELAVLESLWQERLGLDGDDDYRRFGPVV